jgi:hypothetical protein
MALPNQIRTELESHELEDQELFLEWLGAIQNSFVQLRLDTTIDQFQGQFNATTLLSLRHTSRELSRLRPEHSIGADHLAALADGVRRLREGVVGANLPSDVAEFLLKHLRLIDDAIEAYRIRGNDGVRQAVDSAIGALDSGRGIVRDDKSAALWDYTKNTLRAIALALQLTANVVQIEEGFERFQKLLNEPPTIEAPPLPPPPAPGIKDGEIVLDENRRA